MSICRAELSDPVLIRGLAMAQSPLKRLLEPAARGQTPVVYTC